MYLFFDTETSGLPNKFLPLTDSNQARVIQLAAILTDANFKEQGSVSVLVRPDNFNISDGAFRAHGISASHAKQYGVSSAASVQLFLDLCDRASKVFAYNISFDKQLIDIEAQIAKLTFGAHINKLCCVMHMVTPICKMPPTKRGTQYKWPKLLEAYNYFFVGERFDAHNALADCRATLKIVQHLATTHQITL